MKYTIEEIRHMQEGQTFDCKSILIEPKHLATIIVAMANADGGMIAVGISDKTRRVEGVDQDKEHLNDILRTPLDFCVPSVSVTTDYVPCTDAEGRDNRVLLMHIPASPRLHANQADEVFKRAYEKGVGTIVMKPLAGGAIDDGTLAMKYLLSREYIDVAIPGMDSPQQVIENTDVLQNYELTEEDNKKIAKIKSELGTNFCRRCEYCLPCPKGINIPQNFLLEGYYNRYNLKDWAVDRYRGLAENERASNCIECGACQKKCPYELPIIDMLKKVVDTLEK